MGDPTATKVELLFLNRDVGWSETYYFPSTLNDNFGSFINDMALARCKILADECRLTYMRIGETGNRRGWQLIEVDRPGTAWQDDINSTGPRQYADHANANVGMPYDTAEGVFRYVNIGGVLDSWLSRSGTGAAMKLGQVPEGNFNVYYNFLIRKGLKIRQRLTEGNNGPKSVTAVSVQDGYIRLTTPDNAFFPAGTLVKVLGAKGPNWCGVRRPVKGRATSGTTIVTLDAGIKSNLPEPVFTPGMKLQQIGYEYAAATASQKSYLVSTRRRGRPFARHRGRQSGCR